MSHRFLQGISILCLLLCGCRKHHSVTPSFYYWKTSFALTNYEAGRLKQANCHLLYFRAFDVVRDVAEDGAPKPVGIIRHLEAAPRDMAYIPVVFITQDVLAGLKPSQLEALAENIAKLLSRVCTSIPAPQEIQIDCDWTTGTRDAYFLLLRTLRKTIFFQGKKLSATVRLHQAKYRAGSGTSAALSTGIPPVDRGMLMCYNMGTLRHPGAQNSILDRSTPAAYLSDLKTYPLPLDIALPIFSWCIQFHEGKFRGILRGISPDSIAAATNVFRKERGNIYTCIKEGWWTDEYFALGDEVRLENPSAADILEVARYTAGKVSNESLRVVLFHFDGVTLGQHPAHEVEQIFDAYR